jgi:integrase
LPPKKEAPVAALELRNKTYRVVFMYQDRKYGYSLATGDAQTANALKGGVEKTLMLIGQGALSVPAGADVVEFVKYGGKPSQAKAVSAGGGENDQPVRLGAFKDLYLEARSGGSMETNSLATARMHVGHFERTLGADFDLRKLTLADLQRHLNRRRKEGDPRRKKARHAPISPTTLRLEMSTLRAAWNWAVLNGLVRGAFPSRGLQYPKADERPPFMTWEEIDRRVLAGGDPSELWDCLYLRKEEIGPLLAHVEEKATAPWLHPMVATAAYTGARRSELLRMEVADVDFASGVLMVREKKRSRKQRTTRHVSLSPPLAEVLKGWLAAHPGGKFLFCQSGVVARSKKRSRTTGHRGEQARESCLKGRLAGVRRRGEQAPQAVTRDEAHDHLKRTLAGSRWEVLRGYYVLRHSFISCIAAAGVDQRIIDDFVGHCSEEQSRRYRHLVPDVKQKAVLKVFG